jgi:methionyl-tRNA formyltransferase
LTYIYVSNRTWAIDAFLHHRNDLPGNWLLVTTPEDLNAVLTKHRPDYIFFPHWSHIVPINITERFDCVCFHMTDLPFGRGGSPLQNLIVRGLKTTKLTALKMVEQLDAGPIYRKDDLNLDGSALEIFERMSALAIEQIKFIIERQPIPEPQKDIDTDIFTRRSHQHSKINHIDNLSDLFDYIRMLDAPGYPRAYIDMNGFTFEFEKAQLDTHSKKLSASVVIKKAVN